MRTFTHPDRGIAREAVLSERASATRTLTPVPLAVAAAALSLSSAIAHFGVMGVHYELWWLHGIFFAVCGSAQALFALLILRWPSDGLALAGIAGNLTVIAMYVYSRTNGVPAGPHRGVPEDPGLYDLVTTAGEVALVGVLVAMLGPRARRWGMRLVVLVGAGLWTGRATGVVL